MTKIKKHTITLALREYVERHAGLENIARCAGKNALAVKEMQARMMATTILTYWEDIENMSVGNIKI